MYLLLVILLMLICPVASVFVELLLFKSQAGTVFLIGKWFVFWAIGVRLFTADLRQVAKPRFTAEQIFGIKTEESLVLVQELGFANLSLGVLGLCAGSNPTWVLAAAVAGGLFYGLAGIKHLTRKARNRFENGAMISDLFVFIVLLFYFVNVEVLR